MAIRINGPRWGLAECAAALRTEGGPGRLAGYLDTCYGGRDSIQFLPVGSGRVALYLALRALGVGHGSKVAVGAMCCDTVTLPIAALGAQPAFVDTEPGTFCMDAAALDACLDGAKVQAVVGAHFLGQRNDMSAIRSVCRKQGVPLVDDSAYLAGWQMGEALAGTDGDMGVWSFHEKLLSGMGGGVLIGPPDKIASARQAIGQVPAPRDSALHAGIVLVRNLCRRTWGLRSAGLCARGSMPPDWRIRSDLRMPSQGEWPASRRQCALMFAQLRRVHKLVQHAEQVLRLYQELLDNHPFFHVLGLPHGGCYGRVVPVSWKVEALGRPETVGLAEHTGTICRLLYRAGIQVLFYVPPWWSPANAVGAAWPNCQELWGRTICLPSHSLMAPGDVRGVCRALEACWGQSWRAGDQGA
jgi:dTDP-4-amino-4,6-dideoxygalactose transaminase